MKNIKQLAFGLIIAVGLAAGAHTSSGGGIAWDSAAIANAPRGGDLWWGWPVGTAVVGMVGFAVAAP